MSFSPDHARADEASPDDARFVLTGPSGWIGQAVLAVLAEHLGGDGRVGDRVTAFASHPRDMVLASGEVIPLRALASIAPEDVAGAHVIHLAYLTKEKAEELGERVFTDTNLAIDDALFAAITAMRPASLFVASSGAAQLAARGVDLHPYGVAKLRQEARFLAWGRAAGVPVLAGRIFNIAGPYINKVESYAISNFIRQAERDGQIAIQASLPVFRSFLHVADLCKLIIGAALAGVGRAAPVDLCGAQVVEMIDLAHQVAAALDKSVPIRRGPVDWASSSVYLGDFTQTRILSMQLGVDLAPLAVQVAETAGWMARPHATRLTSD